MSRFDGLNEISVHFSETVGVNVITEKGRKLGRLIDYFVDYQEMYPQVVAIQYQNGNQSFYINWDDIVSYNLKEIKIKEDCFIGHSRTFPKVREKRTVTSILANQFRGETLEYPPLGKVILDKQIVDTSGKKVVRVNDIQFIRSGQFLRVTYAEVGMKSMIRRIGLDKNILKPLYKMKIQPKFLESETLINWKFVHAIPSKNIQNSNVKLNLTNDDIKKLHPADIADIIEDLDGHGREALLDELDPKLAAETIQEMDQDVQKVIFSKESPEEAAILIENMDTDDAADILNELDEKQVKKIIANITDQETLDEINQLRKFEEDSAGGLMSTEFFDVSPLSTKKQILDQFKTEFNDIENIYDIFVLDDKGILLGVCPIQNLLLAEENLHIKEFMQTEDIKSLHFDEAWKDVAEYMNKYNLINVPIVDDNNKLLGMVSVDDILTVLLEE